MAEKIIKSAAKIKEGTVIAEESLVRVEDEVLTAENAPKEVLIKVEVEEVHHVTEEEYIEEIKMIKAVIRAIMTPTQVETIKSLFPKF